MQTKDTFQSKLFSLVIPIAFQQLMLAIISATDAIMLGLVDQVSLSAVSLAGQVQFVFSMIIAGSADGSGILIAQYWGKGDKKSIRAIAPLALRINLIAGIFWTVVTIAIPQYVMMIFTLDVELIQAGAAYLQAVSLSYLLFALSQVYMCLLKNIGKAKAVSNISSTAVVLNIILNAILIFGLFGFPKLGIVGAAYATVISRFVELALAVLVCNKEDVTLEWKRLFASEKVLMQDFLHNFKIFVGASVVWGVGSTMYSVILGHMGNDAVAANSIASIVRTLVFCFCRGLGVGTMVMVGNVLGSGELELAKEYGKKLSKLSVLFGIASGLVMGTFIPLIVRFAPLEPTATKLLQGMLIFGIPYMVAKSYNVTVLNGILAAGGEMKFDMYGNIGAMWCFTIPLGFMAAFWWKLPVLAVFCIINLDEIVKIPAVYWYYKKYKWVKDLTRENSL